MIDDTRVFEILCEICENVSPKRSKRGYVARCPVCGDSQKSKKIRRLHIDYYSKHNDFAITCYNGGCSFRSGNIYSLYATVKGITFREAKKYIEEDTYDPDKIKQALSASKAPEVVEEKVEMDFDLHWKDCLWDTRAVGLGRIHQRYTDALRLFIQNRCIPEEYADTMSIAIDGRYKNRIIIPVYQNDKMVYFQGRAMLPTVTPKFLNPDVDKELIISNIDKFDRDKYIIVTEGLIDSWMVEYNQGTAVLGGNFNDRIIEKLFLFTNAGVILVPDNPNIDPTGRKELIRYMKGGKYAGNVFYYLMEGDKNKDLNDLRIARPDLHIYDHIVANMANKWATEMDLNTAVW